MSEHKIFVVKTIFRDRMYSYRNSNTPTMFYRYQFFSVCEMCMFTHACSNQLLWSLARVCVDTVCIWVTMHSYHLWEFNNESYMLSHKTFQRLSNKAQQGHVSERPRHSRDLILSQSIRAWDVHAIRRAGLSLWTEKCVNSKALLQMECFI